jgi:hypothetical protein
MTCQQYFNAVFRESPELLALLLNMKQNNSFNAEQLFDKMKLHAANDELSLIDTEHWDYETIFQEEFKKI